MEPKRRGGTENVEKLGFRSPMHIDGGDAGRKLAPNGGMHVVKTEAKEENGFKSAWVREEVEKKNEASNVGMNTNR